MTDLEIWKRLAKKGYYNDYPRPDIRTRIERMRDYQEMGSLSFLISRRVQAEIRDQQNEVWNERRRITDVDRRIEQLLAIEEKLKAVRADDQLRVARAGHDVRAVVVAAVAIDAVVIAIAAAAASDRDEGRGREHGGEDEEA